MLRRDMLKGIFASLICMVPLKEAKAKLKNIEEERIFEYLENIPEWSEKYIWKYWGDEELDPQNREFLFTGGHDREDVLELYKEEGYALVYSPRHLIQKGHFFDLIWVKIGNKTVTAIGELHRRFPGDFKKLPDCMNM